MTMVTALDGVPCASPSPPLPPPWGWNWEPSWLQVIPCMGGPLSPGGPGCVFVIGHVRRRTMHSFMGQQGPFDPLNWNTAFQQLLPSLSACLWAREFLSKC